jgi:hypothetical protein
MLVCSSSKHYIPQLVKTYTSQNRYVWNVKISKQCSVINITVVERVSAGNENITGCKHYLPNNFEDQILILKQVWWSMFYVEGLTTGQSEKNSTNGCQGCQTMLFLFATINSIILTSFNAERTPKNSWKLFLI